MPADAVRIGVDARSLLDVQPRGEGRALLRLYREIARLRTDWRFVFYGQLGTTSDAPGIPGTERRIFDMPGFRFNLWENVGLPWHVARDGIDLLHSSSSGAPRWTPAPVVMTVHDIIPLLSSDPLDAESARRFRTQLEYGLERARAVITVSEHTKADLVRLFAVDPDKVDVVTWGIDPFAEPAGVAARADGRGGAVTPYMLSFGGDAKRKNTLGTARAFVRFARVQAEIRLVIVGLGAGEVRDQIAREVTAAGLNDRVEIRPYVPDEQIDALLRGAMCLLYLSRYEGFGLPLLEAMTRGVPIVASNLSSIPEVSGNAVLLVDPDSAEAMDRTLHAVATDAGLRDRLSALGRIRAAQFRWSDTAQRTVSVFERVLHG